MAYFGKEKWRRRTVAALSVTLAASLSLGIFAACTSDTTDDGTDDEETTTTQTDTQKIRNGNFEFYEEMNDALADKRDFIASPTDWTFSSGSPTSDTTSGIIDVSEWQTLSASGSSFFAGITEDSDFDAILNDVVSHWKDSDVTVYDRLRFYSLFEDEIDDLDSSSDAAELFDDYQYSIDFEDVEYLSELTTAPTQRTGAAEGDTAVLMIHNRRTSNEVLGTGQHYTSGTTITLEQGTSAELSVWVRTDALEYGKDGQTTTPRSGAYIQVAQTVGGASLDNWTVSNIQTNGEWQEYKLYLRANSFAETTFTVTLGLGGGTSDDRYESVNGYAFFDDLVCTVISNEAYATKTRDLDRTDYVRDLDDDGDAKQYDDRALKARDENYSRTFALDLYMELVPLNFGSGKLSVSADVTKETSGSKTYSSKIKDNRTDGTTPAERQSVVGLYTYDNLKSLDNVYLSNIINKDFDGKFPFTSDNGSENVIMLMSTNGASYTATLKKDSNGNAFTLNPDEYMLVSFWAKTSEIRSGATGASVTLVDGENRTTITAFDTTTADTVDIDNVNTDEYNQTDIYNGWVQCFFYVGNETDSAKTFSLEFNYGPTNVASAEITAYADGYAAFAKFETAYMTSEQYGYATATDYAQTVSLSGNVDNDSQFDSASAIFDIKEGFAQPHSFEGHVAGNKFLVPGGSDNVVPENVYTGMLNAKYAQAYQDNANNDAALNALKSVTGTTDSPATASEWWEEVFGSGAKGTRVANQPLAIFNSGNAAAPSYGYTSQTQTVAANSTQRISVRVKLSANAGATVYLIDTSDVKEDAQTGFGKTLTPTIPKITYWYDDNGNIVSGDPSDEEFNARENTLFYLAENGLYYKAGTSESDADVVYYANLHNYERDKNTKDYVTDDGTIAFYYNEADGKTYAYRTEESAGVYTYSQPVENLPTTDDNGNSIVRYTAPADEALSNYDTAITVNGNPKNNGWTEVVFYVKTGANEKNFRIEVWAGARDNATDGLPANSYVFFDDYVSADAASDYDTLLSEAEDDLKQTAANLDPDDETKLNESVALYYTFTFYDSLNYLRYDVNEDTDNLGNPYGSYTQSSYSEEIVWLQNGTTMFLNYGATDVTVEADDLGSGDDTTTDDDTTTPSDTNIWLVISSSVLAVALLFAIIAIIVRRVHKKVKKHAKAKPVKAPKQKAAPVKPEKPAEPDEADEPTEEPSDDNPYNDAHVR